MQAFRLNNQTDLRFGPLKEADLRAAVSQFGDRVLFVYGGHSIKASGLYDRVIEALSGLNVTELPGIAPNPKIDSVRTGQTLAKANAVQVILAVGGGSVIDAAKVIGEAANYAGDPWDLVLDSKLGLSTKQLPIVDVVTLAATGTEMNINAVISNPETKQKLGARCSRTPAVSFMDPSLTFTVPARQTAAGSMDIFSHLCEQYFDREPDNDATKGMIEGLMRSVIKWTPVALKQPDSLPARQNLMWTATAALNGEMGAGNRNGWSCHAMEHQLSAYYDITHGVGLGILTPRWMHYVLTTDPTTTALFVRFGRNVWHLTDADDADLAGHAIAKTLSWITSLGFGMTLPAVGIPDERNFAPMAQAAGKRLGNAYLPLDAAAVTAIYRASMTPGLA
ncbi:iron-containing alcohol dehydrogenase [Lacticaseibacillus jixianensis]|uniref:Iron-containing alcohol dehydrogenase n=1 Tax=Lacticaseibacillus jixianensis TaxID=2486012 RepID=A0ABW4B6S3_9LACO|nr:iron-containing alcohol dehydrogenase [Lacticaseibacillus jixianensis]